MQTPRSLSHFAAVEASLKTGQRWRGQRVGLLTQQVELLSRFGQRRTKHNENEAFFISRDWRYFICAVKLSNCPFQQELYTMLSIWSYTFHCSNLYVHMNMHRQTLANVICNLAVRHVCIYDISPTRQLQM